MSLPLSVNPTTQEVYEYQRAYFSRPDAVLAKVGPERRGCMYRTQSGNKCAVGCLIPDEVYDTVLWTDTEVVDGGEVEFHETLGQSIEGEAVDEIIDHPLLHDLLNGDTDEGRRKLNFLADAQRLHDDKAIDASHLVTLLDDLAEQYNLEVRS